MEEGGSHSLSGGSEELDEDTARMDVDSTPGAGGRCYPSDELLTLSQQAVQLRTSTALAWPLSQCLRSVVAVLRHATAGRARQRDLDAVRRFLRDDLHPAVERLLSAPLTCTRLATNGEPEQALLDVLQLLALAGANGFVWRVGLLSVDVPPELDADLVPLAQSLLYTFNGSRPLHKLLLDEELPLADSVLGTAGAAITNEWALPSFVGDDDDDDRESDGYGEGLGARVAVEQQRWLTHIINVFGQCNGFTAICTLLRTPEHVGFSLLNMMTAVLAQVVDISSETAKQHFKEVVQPLLAHLSELVQQGSDRLTDHGADRTCSAFQCLVNTNLLRIIRHSSSSRREAAQLQAVQCGFVLRMLESTSFTKLLCGVRECNVMLSAAAQLDSLQHRVLGHAGLDGLLRWMEANSIVQRMLRSNLHQQQYMQEVQGIMVVLTRHGLVMKHMDMLWNIAQKEDAHEAVKAHMYDLLAEVAADFEAEELGALLERLRARLSTPLLPADTLRLLGLLERLAQADTACHQSVSVIDIVWDITTPPDAPAELLETAALSKVVGIYMQHSQGFDLDDDAAAGCSDQGDNRGGALVVRMLRRVLDAFVAHSGGAVPLLRALQELTQLLDDGGQTAEQASSPIEMAIEDLVSSHGLMEHLVDATCALVDAARAALTAADIAVADAAARGEGDGVGCDGLCDDDDRTMLAAAAHDAALATLAEGPWQYHDVLHEHLAALAFTAQNAVSYFDAGLAQRLWDALIAAPPAKEDTLPATQGSPAGGAPLFDVSTQHALLERYMGRQDAAGLGLHAAGLFLDIFHQVNLESRAIAYGPGKRHVQAAHLSDIKGLPFLWAMYLQHGQGRVADLAKAQLLHLYHCGSAALTSAPFRQALVTHIVDELRHHVPTLRGTAVPVSQSTAAGLAVTRCLGLALSAAKLKRVHTMPPVPAHRLAWRGMPLSLEVQRDGAPRLRLCSHSNEYVGRLRERMARAVGCAPKHLRIFLLGHEVTNDAGTLTVYDQKSRAVLTTVISPEPNRFTVAPAEYRPHWEQTALPWLLSQADGLYQLLLLLLDAADVPDGLPSMAQDLLSLLPTCPALTASLTAALEAVGGGDARRIALAGALCSNGISVDDCSDLMHVDGATATVRPSGADTDALEVVIAAAATTPKRTLYALQTLAALLFPASDDLPAPDADTAAQASACPSPAAGGASCGAGEPGPAAQQAAGCVSPPTDAAAAAVAQAHREVLLQGFITMQGLELVLRAAHAAGSAADATLRLRRQLSELLVALLHSLVDAACGWGAVSMAATTAAAASVAAESGAGGAACSTRQDGGCGVAMSDGADAAAAADAAPMLTDTGVPDYGVAALTSNAACCSTAAAATPGMQLVVAGDPAVHAVATSSVEEATSVAPAVPETAALPQLGPTRPRAQSAGRAHRPRSGEAATTAAPSDACAAQLAAVFGLPGLALMAEALMEVAVDTSTVWGTPVAAAAGERLDMDAAVARDALQLLGRLLDGQPALVASLLLERGPCPLITAVLLNVHHAELRRAAAELLERLASAPEAHPRAAGWLLLQLEGARSAAAAVPAACAELYQLLATCVMRLGGGPSAARAAGGMTSPTLAGGSASAPLAAMPEQQHQQQQPPAAQSSPGRGSVMVAGCMDPALFDAAQRMLQEEINHLRELTDAAPASSHLDVELMLPDAAAAHSAKQTDAASATLLQGRLTLLLALVRALDRRSVGPDAGGGLTRLLLERVLFPEARLQAAAAVGGPEALDLTAAAPALTAPASTPSCRRIALDLAAELMADGPAAIAAGASLIASLHAEARVLSGWGVSPKPLRRSGHYVGLKNGGATCYMNSVFQQLFMQPLIRAGVLAGAAVPPDDAPDSVFAQLQALFASMALGRSTYMVPHGFWAAFRDYDGSPLDVREHQDAYEFFTRLQDCVDQHLMTEGQTPAIKRVMGGTFVQQIICRDHSYTSEREEEFYQISVDVKGMGSLERSLDDYVKGELMEGDNAYFCEQLGRKVAAVRRSAIRNLPQLLCVHLKRFEFDHHSQTRYKVRERFEFPSKIDMAKYTEDGLAAVDAAAAAGGDGAGDGGAGATPSAGDRAEAGDGLARTLSDAVAQARMARISGSGAAPATGSSGGAASSMYDLVGVVVHAGSAFAGHYYSYIQERRGSSSSSSSSNSTTTTGRWFCFDDKSVTPWDASELEGECFGGRPSQDSGARGQRPPRNELERAHSAYLLFYERREASSSAEGAGTVASRPSDVEPIQQQLPPDHRQEPQSGVPPMPLPPSTLASMPPPAAAPPEPIGPARSVCTPYGMPEALYRDVMAANLAMVWAQHVLDKDYCRFVRTLLESRGEPSDAPTSSRKARRRDVAGATSGPAPSAMSCEGPGVTAAGGSGAGPAAAASAAASGGSPAGDTGATVEAAAAADAATGGRPQGLSMPVVPIVPPLPPRGTTPDPAASPGPTSRRGEDSEAAACALLRLGVLFQWHVQLRAHESLRGDASVWSEALTSLMGSGPASTACLQLFLELQLQHPDWLQMMLLDTECEVPAESQAWAVDLLGWALEAAGARCARPLAGAVQAALAEGARTAGEPPGSTASRLAGGGMAATTAVSALGSSGLPPLAGAVLGLVERAVALVRGCARRAAAATASASAGMHPEHPDVPTEACALLVRYAALGSWAAAHLMQLHNIVPDVADLIAATIGAEPEEELPPEEAVALVPLYELLAELLGHADNLPRLSAEFEATNVGGGPGACAAAAAAAPANPFLRSACDGACDSGCALPHTAYVGLMSQHLLRGLSLPAIAASPRALRLAQLLCWSNTHASGRLLPSATAALLTQLKLTATAPSDGAPARGRLPLHLAMMALLPDAYASQRAGFLLNGHHHHPQHSTAAAGAGGNSGSGTAEEAVPRPLAPLPLPPGIASWAEPVSWHSMMFALLLGRLLQELAAAPGPPDWSTARYALLHALAGEPLRSHVTGMLRLLVSTIASLPSGETALQEYGTAAGDLLEAIQAEAGRAALTDSPGSSGGGRCTGAATGTNAAHAAAGRDNGSAPASPTAAGAAMVGSPAASDDGGGHQ